MLKVATWNVNSIRSRTEHLQFFLLDVAPDIMLLQETKCENYQFPYAAFTNFPYNIEIHGQKSYNGVAIFSKFPIDEVKTDFPGNPCSDEARFIEISCQTPVGYSRIICLYVPNGGEEASDKFIKKLHFYDAIIDYLEKLKSIDENLIIGGDFNVAPFDIDVYSPSDLQNSTCFTLDERKKMRALLNVGYEDLYRLKNHQIKEFSWWDYRAGAFQKNIGLRIDMILGNKNAAIKLSDCYIGKTFREREKPSDHAPVVAVFEI